MKKFISKILFLPILLLSPQTTIAQQQRTHIQKAVKVLNLNLDSIQAGQKPKTSIVSVKGVRMKVKVDKEGQVIHIGFPLFNQFVQILQPSPIYDYLEYAVLDHKFHISENDLQLKQLKFRKGDWTTLEQVSDTMRCTISNVEDKFYEVTWFDGGQEFVSVNFPINYELLANSNRKEILELFVTSLRGYHAEESIVQDINTSKVKPYKKNDVFVQEGDFYTIPGINTNTYFRKSSNKDSTHYVWLKDKNYPNETLANRLLSPGSFPGNPTLKLTCFLYNHRKEVVMTTLSDWMSFCRQSGCKPYYGFEKNENGTITATLIMRNRESGYDHVVMLNCQQAHLEDADLPLEGRAYIFTPSANVSSLFN